MRGRWIRAVPPSHGMEFRAQQEERRGVARLSRGRRWWAAMHAPTRRACGNSAAASRDLARSPEWPQQPRRDEREGWGHRHCGSQIITACEWPELGEQRASACSGTGSWPLGTGPSAPDRNAAYERPSASRARVRKRWTGFRTHRANPRSATPASACGAGAAAAMVGELWAGGCAHSA